MDTEAYVAVVDMGDEAAEEVALPGFRFHPTDQELVGFYLRRKVEKKPIRIDLIRQVDIYKYDPWDLPRVSNVGDKEWFFFCLRGRKYRNSIRPNRVTGSGFWKATGIDRPVHATAGGGHSHHDCIGLKKSLVYYRGSAGKGTKTDWMMHEFRLPTAGKNAPAAGDGTCLPEAESWTICRIFKRAVPCNKNHHHLPTRQVVLHSAVACNTEDARPNNSVGAYVGSAESNNNSVVTYLAAARDSSSSTDDQLAAAAAEWNPAAAQQRAPSSVAAQPIITTEDLYCFRTPSPAGGEFAFDVDGISWDELGRVVEFSVDPSLAGEYHCGYSLYA